MNHHNRQVDIETQAISVIALVLTYNYFSK